MIRYSPEENQVLEALRATPAKMLSLPQLAKATGRSESALVRDVERLVVKERVVFDRERDRVVALAEP